MRWLDYKQSETDQSVRSRDKYSKRTVTSTYTDDTSGMSSSKVEAERAQRELGKKYKIKDLGDIKFVLGIRVTHD